MLKPQVLVIACPCTALVSYVMKAFFQHSLLGAGAELNTLFAGMLSSECCC